MKNDLNTLSPIIYEKILKANRILLNLHHSPDGDSVGCNLAMMWYLKSINKDFSLISGDSSIPMNFSKLPGFKKIVNKNIFEVDLNKFDLYIVLDSSSTDQITKIRPLDLRNKIETIVIDHHGSNLLFGDINLVDKNSPATSQIIYQLFLKWKVKINYEMATALMIGIYSDTGGFKFSQTDTLTFKIASELAKISTDYHKYVFEMENNNTAGKFKFLGLAYDSIENYYHNNVALTAVSHEDIVNANIGNEDISSSDLSSSLKSVVGWNIGISMVERDSSKVIVSIRTRDSYRFDLTKIVQALDRKYGEGGGHPAAAGCALYLPLLDAKKYLLTIIKSVYPEFSKMKTKFD